MIDSYRPAHQSQRPESLVIDDRDLLDILGTLQSACQLLAREHRVEVERTDADVRRLSAKNHELETRVKDLRTENDTLKKDMAVIFRKLSALERKGYPN